LTANSGPAYAGHPSGYFPESPPAGKSTYPEVSGFARVKEAVRLADFAAHLVKDLREGSASNGMRGTCPLCGKGGPQAFAVYPDEHWHCFHGCGSGDVISLHSSKFRLEPVESMLQLAHDYGVVLPEGRTPGWRRAQKRKEEAVSAVEARLDRRRQGVLYGSLCEPEIAKIPRETPEQHAAAYEDANALWEACGQIAREMRVKEKCPAQRNAGVEKASPGQTVPPAQEAVSNG